MYVVETTAVMYQVGRGAMAGLIAEGEQATLIGHMDRGCAHIRNPPQGSGPRPDESPRLGIATSIHSKLFWYLTAKRIV